MEVLPRPNRLAVAVLVLMIGGSILCTSLFSPLSAAADTAYGSGLYGAALYGGVVLDATGPVISSIVEGTPSDTSITITWSTDEAANSRIDYGATVSYGSASTSASLVTSHSITLTGLSPSTTYHYRIQSADTLSNSTNSSDGTFTTSATPDVTDPSISSISARTPDSTEVTIRWTTDESSDSAVAYGTTASYGATTTSSSLVTSHSVDLSNLLPLTTYHYRVRSADGSGNASFSSDQTFTTAEQGTTQNRPGQSVSIARGPAGYAGGTSTGVSAEISAIIIANRDVFLFAQAQGIALPAYILQVLGMGGTAAGSFTRDLETGAMGVDVRTLQVYLNTHGAVVAATGAGSVGNETQFFGPATKAALIRFQTANGIVPAAGYFGPKTRAYIASHP